MHRFLFILIISFSGCSTLDNTKIAPGYTQAYVAIKNSLFRSDNEIDIEYIKKLPYASMIAKIGNGPSGLMVLESVSNGDEYTWVSADGVYFVIKNGKIIKSQGLPNNLDETLSTFINFEDDLQENQFVNYVSFENPELKNLKVTTRFRKIKRERVDLKLRELDLVLIEETLHSQKVGWNKINQYWTDDEGFIWKSNQYISPRLPIISYVVTKKPR